MEGIKVEMEWRANLALKIRPSMFSLTSRRKGLQSSTAKGASAKPLRLNAPGKGKCIAVSIQAPGILPLWNASCPD